MDDVGRASRIFVTGVGLECQRQCFLYWFHGTIVTARTAASTHHPRASDLHVDSTMLGSGYGSNSPGDKK